MANRPLSHLSLLLLLSLSSLFLFISTANAHEITGDAEVLPFAPDPEPLHVELLSQLSYDQTSADCWGYVDAQGREYAVMGLEKGVSIVDITDPRNISECAFIAGATSFWREMKTLDNYLYAVTEGAGGGLQIIDLSGLPTSATLVNTYTGFSTAHNLYIETGARMAYVVGSNLGNGGIRILDLNNPVSPVEVGAWTDTYVHDIHVRGNIAWAFNGSAGGAILDVANPSSIQVLGYFSYPGLGYTHSGWISEDLRYLAVCDEFDELDGHVANTRVLFFERVGSTWQYQLLSEYTGPNSAIDHNIFIKGDFAYLSNYTYGFTLIDFGSKTTPILAAHYDTHIEDDHEVFEGAWGVYPLLPSGIVLISDINRGLIVLRPLVPQTNVPAWSRYR